jgi:hypothetical protein
MTRCFTEGNILRPFQNGKFYKNRIIRLQGGAEYGLSIEGLPRDKWQPFMGELVDQRTVFPWLR